MKKLTILLAITLFCSGLMAQTAPEKQDFKSLFKDFQVNKNTGAWSTIMTAFYPNGFDQQDFYKRLLEAGYGTGCLAACAAQLVLCLDGCRGMGCTVCYNLYYSCTDHCGDITKAGVVLH